MKLKDFDFRVWSKKENKYINKDCCIGFRLGENGEREIHPCFATYERGAIDALFYKNDDLSQNTYQDSASYIKATK